MYINFEYFLLNKLHNKFIYYKTITTITSYKSSTNLKFLKILNKKIKIILHVLKLYMTFLLNFIKVYLIISCLLN
jgi:hypothetical protein